MAENNIAIHADHSRASTRVYFGVEHQHLATISIADQLKEGAKGAISRLEEAGFNTWLLTGDNEESGQLISHAVGIQNYKAGLLPHDKAEIIKLLQQQGETVAMIGDGINDSEALALADIGIAMGSGSDIAMEVAEVTLRSNDLSLIERAIALSAQTTATIRQNLFWAFIYNLVGIPIAAGILYSYNGFLLNPMIAAAAMALSSVSVVTNSLFLKNRKLKIKHRKSSNRIKKNMTTYQFKTNINCGGCIASVTPKLEAVKEIQSWQVDTENPDKILTVELDNSKPELIESAVRSAGFTLEKI
jgi:Cu2+-exporting ATPase